MVLAQELPRTLPLANKSGYYVPPSRREPLRRAFFVNGKRYVSLLAQPSNSRDWESSSPLPIALSAAEQTARIELGKIAPDQADWIVTDFQISRFDESQGWYYAVTLKPILQLSGARPDAFTVLLDFSGTPGRIAQMMQ